MLRSTVMTPSYAKGPDLDLFELTTHQLLNRTVARFGDREALVSRHQGIRLTWRDLAAEVERIARGLAGLGLEPGDRVGVWSTNCAEWIYLHLGIAQAGLVQVNVNPAYRPHELAYVLRKSGIKALILRGSDHRTQYKEILDEALAAGPVALRHIVYLPDGTEPDSSWRDLLAGGADYRSPDNPHQVANIQYTSGTTGSPKGVLLTHRNLVNNGRMTAEGLRLSEQARVCIPLPL